MPELLLVMLSVSYAGKNAYSAGKTSGVLRGGASGANRVEIILGLKYESCRKAFVTLNFELLEERREYLCLKFAENFSFFFLNVNNDSKSTSNFLSFSLVNLVQ